MDRRDRERYNYGAEYGRGAGYSRDDEHYHSARNLTNEFEREYRGGRRGHRHEDSDSYRPYRSYHEGNELGDMYERLSEGRGAIRSDTSFHIIAGERDRDFRDRDFSERYGLHRNRYSYDRDDSSRMDRHRSGGEDYRRAGSMRRDYDDYGRFGGVGSDDTRGNRYYGLPNATDDYGSGRGSYYGNRNYGGFGAMGEDDRYRRDRRDRNQDRDDWSDSNRNRYY